MAASNERLTKSWWIVAAGGVVAVGVAAGAWIVINRYGGDSFFPGLVAGFVGTLFAFLLALTWERERNTRRIEREAAELDKDRETELRRRFAPVRAELEKNLNALEALVETIYAEQSTTESLGLTIISPELLEGAWTASASRLSQLVADYELIADLATAYGRIEELRWRIRYRTAQESTRLDTMTAPFARQLRDDVRSLIERVARQIDQPTVQRLGLVHTERMTATVGTTASIETRVIRGQQTPDPTED